MNSGLLRITTTIAAVILLAVGTAGAGDWFGWSFGGGVKGSGDRITEERDIRDFTKIRTSGSMDVHVVVGDQPSLSITFDDNLIDLIETRVKGKTLRITCDESYRARKSCLIEITVPKLTSVVSSGSGDMLIENLNGDYFEYNVKGSGDLEIEGEVEEVELGVAGSGDINARQLIADHAEVVIRGSGDVDVYANESFSGSVYGSGDIDYYGKPDHVDKHVSGSGDITRR